MATNYDKIEAALAALVDTTDAGRNFMLGALAASHPDDVLKARKLLERHARESEMAPSYWLHS